MAFMFFIFWVHCVKVQIDKLINKIKNDIDDNYIKSLGNKLIHETFIVHSQTKVSK